MTLPDLLIRLLIGALVFWIGEKVIALVNNVDLKNVLIIVLVIAIVLYVVFGAVWPIR